MVKPEMDWRPKFIPRGYDQLDKRIFKNIFYSTSTDDQFRDPKTHAKTDYLAKFARSKSVQEIHDNNRGRAFKPNRAPLYQRTMCTHTQQFVPRPLDGYDINAECYTLFKEKATATTLKGTDAEFVDDTTTKDSFPQYTSKENASARAPNFKPKQEKHVSDENKLMVTKSASHREISNPTPDQTRTARPAAFRPAYKTHMAIGELSSGTSYKRDYHASKYDSVWPVKFQNQEKPPPAASGYTGKLRLDPEMEALLDPEKFRIGDVVCYGPC